LTEHRVTFKDYLLSAPDLSELDLTRDAFLMREVSFMDDEQQAPSEAIIGTERSDGADNGSNHTSSK
jgi:hypothetical protein